MNNGTEEHVTPLIKRLLPTASPEEQVAAQENLDQYFEVVYRIYERLAREDKLPLSRDKRGLGDTVKRPNDKME